MDHAAQRTLTRPRPDARHGRSSSAAGVGPLDRVVASVHTGEDLLGDAQDRRRAGETLPRGASRDDTDPAPAVDPAVWLLHVRYQRTRCPDLLAALVDEYSGYARALARRLLREGEPLEDLQQVAMENLVTCLQRFDCDRRTPFPGFATPTIIGGLKRHYRDHGWGLRVPRSVHDVAVPARAAADRLSGVLGRTPTMAEVAAEIGVSEEDLLLTESATEARRTLSLDKPQANGRAPSEIPTDDEDLDRADARVALAAAMTTLSERDRTVLRLYFFDELAQAEIARRYGVSQMQISRWIRSSLERLRSRMSPDACAGTIRPR